jgi:hypothetical protein
MTSRSRPADHKEAQRDWSKLDEVKRTIRSTIGGDEDVDVEIHNPKEIFFLPNDGKIDVPEWIPLLNPNRRNRQFHAELEQDKAAAIRACIGCQVIPAEHISISQGRSDLAVPPPLGPHPFHTCLRQEQLMIPDALRMARMRYPKPTDGE